MEIRRVRLNESEFYKQGRLDALKEAPHAFGSTYANALDRSKESWINQNDEAVSGSDRAIFLALSEGKTVGMTTVYRKSSSVCELLQVWVSQNHRRRGVARKLFVCALSWAKEHRYSRLVATVAEGNDAVVEFYQNLGFKNESETVDGQVLTYQI